MEPQVRPAQHKTKKVDAGDAGEWVTYAWDSSDLLTGVVDNVASRTVDYR